MYAGVPIASPVSVSRSSPSAPSARAIPKSATRVFPSRVSSMFSGLMSRWITPWSWAYCEGLGRLARDPERVVHRELPLPPEPVAQALPST